MSKTFHITTLILFSVVLLGARLVTGPSEERLTTNAVSHVSGSAERPTPTDDRFAEQGKLSHYPGQEGEIYDEHSNAKHQ